VQLNAQFTHPSIKCGSNGGRDRSRFGTIALPNITGAETLEAARELERVTVKDGAILIVMHF